MARFLKLTVVGGRKIAINIDQIVTIMPSALGSGTVICTTEPTNEDDASICVEESFDKITGALPN